MNISSIVIHVKDMDLLSEILENLRRIEGCEVVANERDKIVALVSVENFDDELSSFKEIERMNGVASVAMVYSYQEDLDGDLQALNARSELSEILTDDDMNARDIRYGGSVYHRVK